MDFLFFILCTAVLVVLAFAGSSARVVSGIGLIVLGAVAMGEGVQ